MKSTNNKILYIFLTINALIWSCVQLLRNIISIDSMEAITWGELISFGTNKHPPLSGWIMAFFYDITGHCNFVVYLLGQICILIGFIYIYKLAKHFLTEEKAICSVMILQACFYYTYYIFVNSYNCNVLLMMLWPMTIYYFYKSCKENKNKDWIMFGIVSALSFLGKYQIVFLFLALLLYLIFCDREQFKRKGLYLSVIIGSLLILPHVIWLFQNDFFSFTYMLDRTHSQTNNLPIILVKLSHIVYPLKFIIGQVLAILGCIGLYLIIALQAKNIQIINNNENKQDTWFLLFIGIIPIIAQGLMGMITGNRVPSIWGSIMIGISGIMLFYFFPIKFKENTFSYFIKWAYATMGISFIVVATFAILQTQYFIAYPYQKIMPDFNKIWDEKTNNAPLKYVGGNMEYIFQFRHYNSEHPQVVLETFGHKNPWVNHKDVLKSGILVIVGNNDDIYSMTKGLVYLLPKHYKINPQIYDYNVCNKVGKCVKETFTYAIIPPMN